MRLIERSHIDTERWDKLVDSTEDVSVFSYSWYLDATAENWCAVIDDNYSFGLALPYTVRAGQEILYTPIFVRYLELLGNQKIDKHIQDLIHKRFKIIQITFKQKVLGSQFDSYVYQLINNHDDRHVSSQGKRSLSKAVKENLTIRHGKELLSIITRIQDELEGKFEGINRQTLDTLTRLFECAAEQDCLHSFEVVLGDECVGGILCLQKGKRLLYVKGAVRDNIKRMGGMYLALDSAIEFALSEGLIFDFGGSRVKGVRDFNHNLGGRDTVYYAYTINDGPKWFKLARRIRNKWIKK